MLLCLIRHGQSSNNALSAAIAQRGEAQPRAGLTPGRSHDPDLTELGESQARRLAAGVREELVGFRPTHVYCSHMIRAARTAAPLAEVLDVVVTPHPLAHEVFGVYSRDPVSLEWREECGAPWTALAEACPRLDLPDGDPTRPAVRGRETHEFGWGRAEEFLADLRRRHGPHDVVAVVTHHGFASAVVQVALGVPYSDTHRVVLGNTAFHVLDIADDGAVRVEATNAAPHLDHHMPGAVAPMHV